MTKQLKKLLQEHSQVIENWNPENSARTLVALARIEREILEVAE